MRNYEDFVKEAKTKVRKMIDGGQIKDKRLIDKLHFDVPEIKDNIHNHINAKAKLIAGAVKGRGPEAVKRSNISDVTKQPVTAKIYRGLSGYAKDKGPSGVRDNIHARINAKAQQAVGAAQVQVKKQELSGLPLSDAIKRAAPSDIGKRRMTIRRYRGLSGYVKKSGDGLDGLGSKPVIDTGRQLKYGGHQNAKVVGEARSRFGKKNVKIFHNRDGGIELSPDQSLMMDIEQGGEQALRYKDSHRLGGALIELPSKKSTTVETLSGKKRQVPPRLAREVRGTTAFHELSGELMEQMDRDDAIGRHGFEVNPHVNRIGRIGSHETPFVLKRDAGYRAGLSPAARRRNQRMREQLGENRHMNHLILGDSATPDQLAKPLEENLKRNWDSEKVITNQAEHQGYDIGSPVVKSFLKDLARGK